MIHKHPWTQEIDALPKAIERLLRKIGIKISGDAITQAPVDTGRLRGSITYALKDEQSEIQSPAKGKDRIKKPSEKYTVHIGTNLAYSQYVEYGTRFMDAQPYLRPALDKNRKMIPKNFSAEISKAFRGK